MCRPHPFGDFPGPKTFQLRTEEHRRMHGQRLSTVQDAAYGNNSGDDDDLRLIKAMTLMVVMVTMLLLLVVVVTMMGVMMMMSASVY